MVKTSQLSNISLDECPLRSRVPMIMNDCGELRTHQRILAINGISVEGEMFDAVKNILSKQRENAETVTLHVGKLLVGYRMGDPIKVKKNQKFGMSIQNQSVLPQVRTIRKESVLHNTEANEGDYILSINEVDVSWMNFDQVMAVIFEKRGIGEMRFVFLHKI